MLSESLFLTLSHLNLARDMRRQLPKLVRKHRSVLPELSQPRWTEQPISPTHLWKISWGNDSWKAKIWSWQPCGFCSSPKNMPPSHLLRPTNLNPKTNTTGKVVKPEPGGFTFHQNWHLSLPRHHRSVNVLKSRGFSPKAESCCHQAHGHHGHPLAWTPGNVGQYWHLMPYAIVSVYPVYCICIFGFLSKFVFRFVRAGGCRPPIVLICISLAVLVPSWNICESL